jgi:PEP-CTERM motif
MSSWLRKSILRFALLTLSSAAAFVPVSAAGSIRYSFSGLDPLPSGGALSVAFVYTAPGFINPTQPFLSLLASQLDSCTNCFTSTFVPAVSFSVQGPIFGDEIDFADFLGTEAVYAFPLGAFLTPGTYQSLSPFNPGTLVVSNVSATPEPSSIFLFASGLLLLAGISLRSRRATSV